MPASLRNVACKHHCLADVRRTPMLFSATPVDPIPFQHFLGTCTGTMPNLVRERRNWRRVQGCTRARSVLVGCLFVVSHRFCGGGHVVGWHNFVAVGMFVGLHRFFVVAVAPALFKVHGQRSQIFIHLEARCHATRCGRKQHRSPSLACSSFEHTT